MSSLSSTQPAYIDTRRWRRHRVSVPIRVILLRPNKTTIVDGRGHGLSEGGMALTAGLELSVEDQIMVEFTPPYSGFNEVHQILSTRHKRILEAGSPADEPPRV